MSSPAFHRDRLLKLADLYATDDIAREEVAELEALLGGSEEARQIFGRYIQFEVGLTQSLECSEAFDGLLAAMANSAAAGRPVNDGNAPGCPAADSAPHESADGVWTRARVWLRKPEFLSVTVAALVLVAAISTLAIFNLPQRNSIGQGETEAAPVVVARLTAVHNVKWAEGQTDSRLGARLPAGKRMELKQGLAEVTFQSGARVTMEAPAALVLGGAGEGHLEVGNVVALVPAPAIGFTLSTPTAVITDLGTEFGVTAQRDGTTRVLVFEGRVEVDAGSQLQRLESGEGVLVTSSPTGVGLQRQWNEELASSLQAARESLAQAIVSVAQSGAVGKFECATTDLADASRSLARIELRSGSAAYGSDVSELFDGDMYGGQGSDLTTHSFTPVNGTVVVITLDTSAHPLGYDIHALASLSGTFQSRAKHHYSVESRPVGGDFAPMFEIRPTLRGNDNPGTGEVSVVTKRTGEPLAVGVDTLRITFHDIPGAEFPETMYREFDVFGEPTARAAAARGEPP